MCLTLDSAYQLARHLLQVACESARVKAGHETGEAAVSVFAV